MTGSIPYTMADVQATIHARNTRWLGWLSWAYILLLIFEGSLRKWVLPSLATPLLIIRDPVVLLMLVIAAVSRYRILNPYTLISFAVTIIAVFLSMSIGHQNLGVTVFGVRITALHFAIIFITGQVFSRDDVLRVGKFFLWMIPPMVLLIGLQYYSPQTAWINRGIGGDSEGAGFAGSMGFFRPPGTFSFTIGVTHFFGLASAFVLYFWIGRRGEVNRLLLMAATVGMLLAIPLSLSRGYVFQLAINCLFLLIASMRSGSSFGKILLAVAALPFVVAILYQFAFFQTSIDVLLSRFTEASKSEGGLEGTLLDRLIGTNVRAIAESPHKNGFWGQGIGIGTNVGSKLITGGAKQFLVGEQEWERIVGELGLLLGLTAIAVRVILAFHVGIKAIGRLLSRADPLPWMLCGYAVLQLIIGQWAPPTVQGFGVLGAALVVASFNPSEKDV